jgi:membrane protein YqaA with SNARE-associated domain
MVKRLGDILLHAGHNFEDRINLRRWFVFYVIYVAALAAVALISLRYYEPQNHHVVQHIWLWAWYMFYMSLCCTFFPAPTAWLVMLMASPVVALVAPQLPPEQFMVSEGQVSGRAALVTIVTVAGAGALGTALANLNEYHIFTFLLRFGWVHKVRRSRWYRSVSRWFALRPFSLMTVISFLPIPVDVVRWLAISNRYRRDHYFLANFVGRFFRYGILAATATCLKLDGRGIIIIQLSLIGLLGLWYVPRLRAWGKAKSDTENVISVSEAALPQG